MAASGAVRYPSARQAAVPALDPAAGRREAAVEQWNAVLQLSPGNRRAEMYLKLAEAAAERSAT